MGRVPRDKSRSEAQRGQRPRVSNQTQRGLSPDGQTRPSEVRTLRARHDPAWSKASGQDKTQRGQRPEGQTRPSEVKVLRASQDPAWSKAQSV